MNPMNFGGGSRCADDVWTAHTTGELYVLDSSQTMLGAAVSSGGARVGWAGAGEKNFDLESAGGSAAGGRIGPGLGSTSPLKHRGRAGT